MPRAPKDYKAEFSKLLKNRGMRPVIDEYVKAQFAEADTTYNEDDSSVEIIAALQRELAEANATAEAVSTAKFDLETDYATLQEELATLKATPEVIEVIEVIEVAEVDDKQLEDEFVTEDHPAIADITEYDRIVKVLEAQNGLNIMGRDWTFELLTNDPTFMSSVKILAAYYEEFTAAAINNKYSPSAMVVRLTQIAKLRSVSSMSNMVN